MVECTQEEGQTRLPQSRAGQLQPQILTGAQRRRTSAVRQRRKLDVCPSCAGADLSSDEPDYECSHREQCDHDDREGDLEPPRRRT